MVELKDRLQRALNPTQTKMPNAMMNGAYNVAQNQQRQRYPSNSVLTNKPSTPVGNYYNPQDSFNSAVPSYPPRPTTPFQNQWAAPVNNYNSPPAAATLPPMVNVPTPPSIIQSAPQFQQPPQQFQAPPQQQFQAPPQQQFQAPPPPPPAASMVPPPTSGNVSRAGPLTQRNRVYVQDPSVSSGRGSAGYFNSGVNSQFQQGNSMSYPQPNSMFQPSGQFNNPSSYSQQNAFAANQPLMAPTAPAPFQPGQLSNGSGFDGGSQLGAPLYSPLDQTPQQGTSFMQPTLFDVPPSITPPLGANLVPTIPTLPATTAPPGWNDPPPLTSMTKTKTEVVAAVETISQPIFPAGVVEHPAVPRIQPFDGSYNPSMSSTAEMMQQYQAAPEPAPVEPPPVLAPIPMEHLIIHDVFHTLKDKCLALASNAVNQTFKV